MSAAVCLMSVPAGRRCLTMNCGLVESGKKLFLSMPKSFTDPSSRAMSTSSVTQRLRMHSLRTVLYTVNMAPRYGSFSAVSASLDDLPFKNMVQNNGVMVIAMIQLRMREASMT